MPGCFSDDFCKKILFFYLYSGFFYVIITLENDSWYERVGETHSLPLLGKIKRNVCNGVSVRETGVENWQTQSKTRSEK